MVTASVLVSLLAVLASTVILGTTIYSRLHRARRFLKERDSQLYLDLVDTVLLLSLLPLLAYKAVSHSTASIVQTLFKGTPSTFFATAALVLRPAFGAVLAANVVLSKRMRRSQAVPLAAAAAVGIVGAATIASVQCEFSHPAGARVGCAQVPAVKGMVVAMQILFTLAAVIFTVKTSSPSREHPTSDERSQTVSPPARVHIQSLADGGGTKQVAGTGDAVDLEYGGRIVSGILDDVGQDAETAATSSGYGSAIASSANPYRSTLSFAPHSEARGAASDRSQPTSFTHVAPPRKNRDAWTDFAPHAAGRKTGRATLKASRDKIEGSAVRMQGNSRRVRMMGKLCLLVLPVALCSTALLLAPADEQTFLIVAAFCTPAAITLIKTVLQRFRHRARESYPNQASEERLSSANDGSSTECSLASVVMVANASRARHMRSYSFPLEAENGYTAAQRGSLASAKSVPYLRQHWAAGKVSGDRVAPRSSWIRAVNLLVNPKPRLEVLPARQIVAKQTRRDERCVLTPSATSAVVRGLLEARENAGDTVDSEHTCISQRPESVTTLNGTAAEGTAIDHEVQSMDDSPGSARRWSEPVDEQSDLRSPTKRVHEAATPPTTSFSNPDESRVLGSGAARLFNEIMDMVRGADHDSDRRRSFGAGLKRTPPHGYTSLDDTSRGTVVVHLESSYATANSPSNPEPGTEMRSEGRGHRRTGSASSTFSLSSISSRLRAMGRGDADSPAVKKVRSRTFASAFGIELGTLARSASWGRKGVESSPSTSAGTCQSSLLDVGFSPSPAAPQHRRMGSHAEWVDVMDADEAVEELDGYNAEEGASSGVSEWTRDMTGDLSDVSLPLCQLGGEEEVSEAEIVESYRMVRLAAAPFLDTVEEESEAESEPAVSATPRRMEQAGWHTAQLLAQHEAMFPHKTLSQIDEVTEAATSPPLSETASARTSARAGTREMESGASDAMQTPSRARHTVHLGLRMSKAVHTASEGVDTADNAEQDDEEGGDGSGDRPTGLLPFVTPRSRMRCRVAEFRVPQPEAEPSHDAGGIEPSPRCQSARLEELGMHEGIWQRSPIKLELSTPASQDTQAASEETRGTRLRRSMTLKWGVGGVRDRLGSPKREVRNRLARSSDAEPEKRLLHKPLKKPRKSRLKGVAVMIARHQFTVVDEDDSLVQQKS